MVPITDFNFDTDSLIHPEESKPPHDLLTTIFSPASSLPAAFDFASLHTTLVPGHNSKASTIRPNTRGDDFVARLGSASLDTTQPSTERLANLRAVGRPTLLPTDAETILARKPEQAQLKLSSDWQVGRPKYFKQGKIGGQYSVGTTPKPSYLAPLSQDPFSAVSPGVAAVGAWDVNMLSFNQHLIQLNIPARYGRRRLRLGSGREPTNPGSADSSAIGSAVTAAG